MADYKDFNNQNQKDELYYLLEKKPKSWRSLLTSRAVARGVPMLSDTIGADFHDFRCLFIFKSISTSMLYSLIPDKNIGYIAERYSSYSADYDNSYDQYSGGLDSNDIASAALDLLESLNDNYHAIEAIEKIGLWDVVEKDVFFLLGNSSEFDLSSAQLWPTQSEPLWSTQRWKVLAEYFENFPHEHWDVWIDWWEDRRDGKPYNIDMEREIVLIPDEDWQQGPAHVNAMIAEIRARYAVEDTPADNLVAPRFETVEGQIALRADAPDTLPTDDQAGLYDALHSLTVELSGLCPENSNRYAQQGKAIGKFLRALGDDYGSMHPGALWMAGQSLRRHERADTAKRAAGDSEDEPMEPDQGALFEEVVTTYNVFSTGEPKLKALDEKGRDPATLIPDVKEEARDMRAAVGEAAILFDDDVPYVLDQVIEETDDPVAGIQARGTVLTRETHENLLGAILRMARKEPKPEQSEISKGAKTAIGAGAVGGSAYVASAFVAVYETTLLTFAAKLPASAVWINIIKSIAAKWAG